MLRNSRDGIPEPIRTFAMRLARRCSLERICSREHPVMITELHLIEMAKSKLQEYVLINVPYILPEVLENQIRNVASMEAASYVNDEATRRAVMRAIWREKLDDLVPAMSVMN